MDESYGTYVDDECFDNHDYDVDDDDDTDDDTDDNTDDDHDDDTDDDNDHKKDSYTAAGAAPDAGALQNIFLGGTVKKTSGARPIFLDTGTVPNLVFLGGGEFFNLP